MKAEEVEKLKPCPFCGSNTIHDCGDYFKCLDCGSFGPSEITDVSEPAVELWNARKSDSDAQKALTRIKDWYYTDGAVGSLSVLIDEIFNT